MENDKPIDLDEIDQFICDITTRKGHRMDQAFTYWLKAEVLPIIKKHCPEAIPPYIVIQGVDQTRGRAYLKKGTYEKVTVPLWVKEKGIDYAVWYLSHELAHIADWIKNRRKLDHGPLFMEQLKRICPPNCIHHELGYKPRNASAAGIGFENL